MFRKLMKFEEQLPEVIKRWNKKNTKHSRVIPRMIVFMFLATIFSGLIYSQLDLIVYIVFIALMFFVLFFLPDEKLISIFIVSNKKLPENKQSKKESNLEYEIEDHTNSQ